MGEAFASLTFTLGRACLSGALVAAVVWLVCRLRLPAAVRAWLWWLACVKFVVGLLTLAPVAVPILPARVTSLPPLLASHRPAPAVRFAAPPSPKPAAPATSAAAFVPPAPVLPASPSPSQWLLTVWLAGVLTALGVSARQAGSLRGRLQNARTVTDDGLKRELAAAADAMKARAPRLVESAQIAGPLVTGAWKPTLALPVGFGEMLTADERRLAFAHELAHVKRGDLRLGLVPFLARALFFFHPFVWLAVREYAQAREEACDALALRAASVGPVGYARLLVKMAGRTPALPALGLSAGAAALRRRLLALGRPSAVVFPRWAVLLLAPVLLSLVPWHLTVRAHSPPPVPSAAATYALSDLGPADGATFAAAVNNAGDVVGGRQASQSGRVGEAWVETGGAWQTIGALTAYRHSLASGVNNRGQVIGSSYNVAGFHHAFVGPDGARELGALPGFPFSRALAINDAGQIVGWAQANRKIHRGVLPARAFVWQNGRMTDLGTLGGDYSAAFGVNNRGQIVGKASVDARQTHAFLWESGAMLDLDTLGGRDSLAHAVNDSGQIVGASDTPTGARHACLWTNGAPTDLGALTDGADSEAKAVNARGEIVGSSGIGNGQTHAVLWRDGKPVDLNSLLPRASGWTLEDARGINDRGQIVGSGHWNGRARAFLLGPQSERTYPPGFADPRAPLRQARPSRASRASAASGPHVPAA